MDPWLTVVTVVKDDPSGLQDTVDSLASGDLSGVEHIVVDGSQEALQFHNLTHAAVVREPPVGIYPAMNVGLSRASGAFVWFLNAGDLVSDQEVLGRVRREVDGAVWAYGPVVIESSNGTTVETPAWDYETERRHYFARGHFPPHQGTFVFADTARAFGGFDTSYRICADYALSLRLSKISKPIELSFPIARFKEGGISTVQWRASVREFHRARREIPSPTGLSGVAERMRTARQYALLGAYRTLFQK
jgi:glycosyltransferase involved in cell wall biosynthesis